MHDYAIDGEKRRRINEIIISFYMLIAFFGPCIGNRIVDFVIRKWEINQNSLEWAYVSSVVAILLSGVGIGIVYKIYDQWLWRCFVRYHKIPNLNGKWIAEIESPLKGDRKPQITMTIRQTWNKIQVNGISEHGTVTVSESASILNQHGQIYFSYAYWIIQKNGQCYPGFNSLRLTNGTLSGEYFSAKNVQDDLEKGCLHMVGKKKVKRKIVERIGGCGSKETITLRKL